MKPERKARLNEIRQKLAKLTEQEKAALLQRGIIFTIEGRALSAHNCYMIYLQCPGHQPSVVGGFKQWRKAGRTVTKGQHGMSILFPAGSKDPETGDITEANNFFAATVFDIEQTEELETPAPAEQAAPIMA